MWDLPGPGLEPLSPALADGFLTTAPPGKPNSTVLKSALWLSLSKYNPCGLKETLSRKKIYKRKQYFEMAYFKIQLLEYILFQKFFENHLFRTWAKKLLAVYFITWLLKYSWNVSGVTSHLHIPPRSWNYLWSWKVEMIWMFIRLLEEIAHWLF